MNSVRSGVGCGHVRVGEKLGYGGRGRGKGYRRRLGWAEWSGVNQDRVG